jgi:ABC-2 type transport system ATP-binding protein
MKMEIILSLIHQPELILMDEPTIGLDGTSRRRIRDFLSYINKEKNITIILTSHYLEDVKELCGRLVIIDDGSIVYDGSTRELIAKNTESVIFHVSFTDPCIWSNWDNENFPFTMEEDKAVFHISGKDIQVLGARLFTLPGIQDIGMEQTPIDEIIEKIYREGRNAFCQNI